MPSNGKRLKGTTRAPNGRWKAQISINGKPLYLGTFDTDTEANEAYLKAYASRDTIPYTKQEEPPLKEKNGIRVGHIYTYQGGIGAGMALNGSRFLVQKFLPGNIALACDVIEGTQHFGGLRRVNMTFLNRASEEAGPAPAPAPPLSERIASEIRRIRTLNPEDPVLGLLQEALSKMQQEEVETREAKKVTALLQGTADIAQTIPWLISKVDNQVATDCMNLLLGKLSPQVGLNWLTHHTTIPPRVLQKVAL